MNLYLWCTSGKDPAHSIVGIIANDKDYNRVLKSSQNAKVWLVLRLISKPLAQINIGAFRSCYKAFDIFDAKNYLTDVRHNGIQLHLNRDYGKCLQYLCQLQSSARICLQTQVEEMMVEVINQIMAEAHLFQRRCICELRKKNVTEQ